MVQDVMLEYLSVCRIANIDIDMITVLLDHGYDPNSDIVYTYGKIELCIRDIDSEG